MLESPVKTSIVVFFLLSCLVGGLSYSYYLNDFPSFYENLLVEAHGVLFDLIVFGTIILLIDQVRQKNNEKKRLIELIEDYSAWHSDESAFRVFGAYKRLRNLNINYSLRNHYLRNIRENYANFNNTDLTNADFSGSIFLKADFRFAWLRYAAFRDTYLDSADFMGANLFEADFSRADLSSAIFFGTTIQRAKLNHSVLDYADFNEAFLFELDLRNCSLNKVDLNGVVYCKVQFPTDFDPHKAGMVEVDEEYNHVPSYELVRNQETILTQVKDDYRI